MCDCGNGDKKDKFKIRIEPEGTTEIREEEYIDCAGNTGPVGEPGTPGVIKSNPKTWFGHFEWFWVESKSFMSHGYVWLLLHGCLIRAIIFSNYMVKYNKLTYDQKLMLYVNEDRLMYFDE